MAIKILLVIDFTIKIVAQGVIFYLSVSMRFACFCKFVPQMPDIVFRRKAKHLFIIL